MKTQESLMTIIALVIGLCITLALIFFNFSLAFTLKLLKTGSVPLGRYLFMISICTVNTGVVIWLGYILKKAQKPTSAPLSQTPRRTTQTIDHRQEQSKNLILSLAHSQKYLSLEDVMNLTGLNADESENLLDELVQSNKLKTENQYDRFLYSLNKTNMLDKEQLKSAQ